MKLSSLFIIGIVISVLWCFIIIGLTILEYKNNTQPDSSPSPKTKEYDFNTLLSFVLFKYDPILLLLFYGFSLLLILEIHPYPVTIISMVIIFFSLILLLIVYFHIRSYLLKKDFWKKHINYSDFLPSIISYSLVLFFVMGSLLFIGKYEKGKEVKEFTNNYNEQFEIFLKQENEYLKTIVSKPKTESELKYIISKLDEYKKFQVKGLIINFTLFDFYREINSKYNKDKSIDEQINKLPQMYKNHYNMIINLIDVHKKYLITGDKKYLFIMFQENEKQKSLRIEINKLLINIYSSLYEKKFVNNQ